MPFSNEIKEQVFVACARRCCVCKKFKGRNIEVHHIIQQTDGGEDTLENAIPLCFDCHADAGHYNPKHPRGSKFSPKELRQHRDAWYQVVRDGRYCQAGLEVTHHYFLTDSADAVWEIVKGDFSSLPMDGVKIIKNEVFEFLVSAANFQKDFNRESAQTFAVYESYSDFLKKHPDAKNVESEWGVTFPKREVSLEELRERYFDKDFVANFMIRNGASPIEVADVSFLEASCGGGNEEQAILRKFKVVFLAVINSGAHVIQCHQLKGHVAAESVISIVDAPFVEEINIDLSNWALESGECLLIPYYIVLAPLRGSEYKPENVISTLKLPFDQIQETRKVMLENFENRQTIGPRFKVSSMTFSVDGETRYADFRPLPNQRPLMISRYWEVGSCPHFFILNGDSGKWEYVGELFDAAPFVENNKKISLKTPLFRHAVQVKVLEIENEITFIEYISIDGKQLIKNVTLEKHDEIVFDVLGAELVEISGHYLIKNDVVYHKDPSLKRQKIVHALADMNRQQYSIL